MSRRVRLDPDEIALLEEERDFLLRSLEDLERERAGDNVTADDYERLRDDYTARAAAVIRSLREGLDTRPQAPPWSTGRKAAVAIGIAAFAVAAGLLLARSVGERLPGETVTGNEQLRRGQPAATRGGTRPPSVDDLRAAVASDPDNPRLRIAYAAALLNAGEAADALQQYDKAARLDPSSAEARAYGGWIVFLAGLPEEALERLDAAVEADARFPDTYFFRAMVRVRGTGDREGARRDLRRYLELAPRGPFADEAEVVLRELAR